MDGNHVFLKSSGIDDHAQEKAANAVLNALKATTSNMEEGLSALLVVMSFLSDKMNIEKFVYEDGENLIQVANLLEQKKNELKPAKESDNEIARFVVEEMAEQFGSTETINCLAIALIEMHKRTDDEYLNLNDGEHCYLSILNMKNSRKARCNG